MSRGMLATYTVEVWEFLNDPKNAEKIKAFLSRRREKCR